jgi:hypothetical protein
LLEEKEKLDLDVNDKTIIISKLMEDNYKLKEKLTQA